MKRELAFSLGYWHIGLDSHWLSAFSTTSIVANDRFGALPFQKSEFGRLAEEVRHAGMGRFH